MIRKTTIMFFAVLITMFGVQQLYGANGRISGKVVDATTGEPLYGANIILEGTSLGAASDMDGKYLIPNIPANTYPLKVSYIGYNTVTYSITIKDDQHIEQNIRMDPVTVSATEVIVTAQASGQNAAINRQLSSDNIVNVVSSSRIQELPDANAAESIGRLPGVSLVRDGGQATQVVIRGMSPQYNQITIAGVPVPSNEGARNVDSRDPLGGGAGGGRGVDMRMISSGSLANIEVYKTNSPDMDAAVLGGTVNLGIRKANKSVQGESPLGLSYLPGISFGVQSGYTDLTSEYNSYKFDLSLERRFLDDRLGVFVQGVIQQQNFTSDRLDANYTQPNNVTKPDSLALYELNLFFTPRLEKRYNGTITIDYDIPDGNITLTNLFSQSKSTSTEYRQQYGLERGGNNIHYYYASAPRNINLITNILAFEKKTPFVDIDATLSHSYSENISPDYWRLQFEQLSVGTDRIFDGLRPVQIAAQAHKLVNMDQLNLRLLDTSTDFTKERVLRGAVDLSKVLNIADFLSLELKAGGMYSYANRSHDHNEGSGAVFFGGVGANIVSAYPFLGQPPYNIGGTTTARIFMTPLLDPSVDFGKYLKGDYAFDNRVGSNYMEGIKKIIIDYGLSLTAPPTGGAGTWVPSRYGDQNRDYSGNEKKGAGYLMGTFHFGQSVSVMAGARYQSLTTSYKANQFYNGSVTNPYPAQMPHLENTVTKTHGYWLPAVNAKFNPLPWISLRASYTNTLAYPNYRDIIPIINVESGGPRVVWNNVDLKPALSQNFDLQLSVYNNELGLFTLGGYMKNIDDLVFFQSNYISDATKYPGLYNVPEYPNLNVKAYRIATYFNNPNQVKVWGIETDWQTHFWYLPGVLSGLVLNVNFTHVFSEAKYPRTIVGNSGFPYFRPIYTDTTYTDKLINQPDNIVNVSLGWDYQGFSVLLSAIYQSAIFNSTNFYNSLRTDRDKYLRWDLVAKQKLPWYNIELYLNLSNLNGADDINIIRGNGFKDLDESYGLTAELGARIRLH